MADIKELTNGQSMGKIGDFEFYMHKNEYEKISNNYSATFGGFQPIKGQKKRSDSGGYSRDITLNGVLVLEPLDSLDSLVDMFKNRKVVRFTTLKEDIDVLIMKLVTVQKKFTDDGKYTVQTYNLSLEEQYDDELQ